MQPTVFLRIITLITTCFDLFVIHRYYKKVLSKKISSIFLLAGIIILILESKIYVPERNKLIVDTWIDYVKDKRTVIFCASVKHAEEIATLFATKNVTARAVSGVLYADKKGRVNLSDIVAYFREFYENRRRLSLIVEKKNSIFAKGDYSDSDAKRNILANPFKRFEDMQMLFHTKTLGIIQVEETVWKHLTDEERTQIATICDEKLEDYFGRI